jgi:thiamine biosynthesis protein ThiI
MDKEEITAQAQKLGSYETSIVPDEDCCTLFTPRHPVTSARRDDIATVEQRLPLAEMVAAAVAATVLERFQYPAAARELPVVGSAFREVTP